MTQLFLAERHEALTDDPWDPGVARRAIEDVAADVLGAARDGLWPTHPLEDGGADDERTLYMGSAGVLWGLSFLAQRGVIRDDERLSRWALLLPERYRAAPDTGRVEPSYFLGEAGVLVAALRVERRPEWEQRLFEVVKSNVHHPALEALWGAPGTALAAVFAGELSGDERWRTLFLENVQALQGSWQRREGDAYHLWTQDLYGRQRCMLGAAHGLAGNVFTFLRGFALLPEAQRNMVLERAVESLRATALVDGERANWPAVPGSDARLVQWCHGAPGIVTSFARAPAHAELDVLLRKGAELTWQAGPLRKGANLCHGTAGNGAALLAMFGRTQDEMWLARARRFAMHAVGQVAAARAAYGQARYSLWTGDVGVALYLHQCISAESGLPSLDF